MNELFSKHESANRSLTSVSLPRSRGLCWSVRSGYAWTWREWAESEVVMRPDAVGRADKGTRLRQGPVACLVLFDHLYLTATPFVLTAYSP